MPRTAPRSLAVALTTCLMLALAAGAPAVASARTLQIGDQGRDVAALKQRLRELGYLPATAGGSRFDAATAFGVRAFQHYAGLARDGVHGPQTRRALRDASRPRPRMRGSRKRIEVDLRRQIVLLIRNGRVVRVIAVSTGGPGNETPRGRFSVQRQERRSWSVPFRVWLDWASYFHAGYAFHAYRSVPPYPASHGCVRVPPAFAREVYRFARGGTSVVVG